MALRTDIAVEFLDDQNGHFDGVSVEEYSQNSVKITEVRINTDYAAEKLGKPKGIYITFETDACFDMFLCEELCSILAEKLFGVIGRANGTVLVVGIGNSDVTPDALGPKAAKGVIATRHIESHLAESIGLKGVRPVSVVSPGVLGQTGLEISEIVKGIISKIKVDRVILIDALAAKDVHRLGKTVQISNIGVVPGSGVGNSRIELSRETLGVDCVTIGVPTVVDAATLCEGLTGVGCTSTEPFIVTTRDIDMIIKCAADLISSSLNRALQPDVDSELLTQLAK